MTGRGRSGKATVTISAQVSVYPLRQERLGPTIDTVLAALQREHVEVRPGAMSTLVSGEAQPVFAALREGFERAAAHGDVVMVFTVSNACPVEERETDGVGDL